MKACANHHITGTKVCWCGAKAMLSEGTRLTVRFDKRAKRSITQLIRIKGGTPVADLRRLWVGQTQDVGK